MIIHAIALLSPFILDALADVPTVLANGTSYVLGNLPSGLQWQSSGVLTKGCDLQTSITDCYGMSLVTDPTKQIDEGFAIKRQRVEFRGPDQNASTTYTYSWKHYFVNQNTTTPNNTMWFDLMQVKTVDQERINSVNNNPFITLNAINSSVQIQNLMDGVGCNNDCPAVPMGDYADKTTLHTMVLTPGPSGKIQYTVADASTGKTILSYSTSGPVGTRTAYVKYGIYRSVFEGMTTAQAAAGDYVSTVGGTYTSTPNYPLSAVSDSSNNATQSANPPASSNNSSSSSPHSLTFIALINSLLFILGFISGSI